MNENKTTLNVAPRAKRTQQTPIQPHTSASTAPSFQFTAPSIPLTTPIPHPPPHAPPHPPLPHIHYTPHLELNPQFLSQILEIERHLIQMLLNLQSLKQSLGL